MTEVQSSAKYKGSFNRSIVLTYHLHEGGKIMKRFYSITAAIAIVLLLTFPASMAADMTAKDLVSEAKKEICEVSVSEAKDLFDKK